MKTKFFAFKIAVLLFTCIQVYAQDFAKVDQVVQSYPKSFGSVDDLAGKINADFKRDDEKARAIFTWIAFNIRYDIEAYLRPEQPVAYSYRTPEEKIIRERQFKDELALKTLKSKKAVCQGYSTLFQRLAEKTGLEAAIIPGTSKTMLTHIGKKPGVSDHVWNAVKIGDSWKLIDVTWGAGTVTGNPLQFSFRFNDGYFFTSPDDFVLNHYPDNEKWLLTNADKDDFASFPLYYGSYLMEGFRFIAPGKGLVAYAGAGTVPFKIKNLKPGDKIAYSFSKDRVFKEVRPKQNGDVAEFEIPIGSNTGGYLTVYINQRSVAAYRIVKS